MVLYRTSLSAGLVDSYGGSIVVDAATQSVISVERSFGPNNRNLPSILRSDSGPKMTSASAFFLLKTTWKIPPKCGRV